MDSKRSMIYGIISLFSHSAVRCLDIPSRYWTRPLWTKPAVVIGHGRRTDLGYLNGPPGCGYFVHSYGYSLPKVSRQW